MSINGFMEKYDMVYPHNEILPSHGKEWSTDVCIQREQTLKTLCKMRGGNHKRPHIV